MKQDAPPKRRTLRRPILRSRNVVVTHCANRHKCRQDHGCDCSSQGGGWPPARFTGAFFSGGPRRGGGEGRTGASGGRVLLAGECQLIRRRSLMGASRHVASGPRLERIGSAKNNIAGPDFDRWPWWNRSTRFRPRRRAGNAAITSAAWRGRRKADGPGHSSHWGIENKLHYVLDVSFAEDQCRIRKGHAAENSAASATWPSTSSAGKPTKTGIKGKRLLAGWDHDYLLKLLSG